MRNLGAKGALSPARFAPTTQQFGIAVLSAAEALNRLDKEQ